MGVLRPVGPLPASAYWLRRGLLLLPLVLVLLLVRACSGGSTPQPRPQAAVTSGSPSLSQSASPAPSATSASPSASAGPSPPVSPSASAGKRACPDAALQVSVRSVAVVAPAGAPSQFRLLVRNTSATPCRRDLGPRAVSVTVTSGADRVWSSEDCGPGGGRGVVELAPGGEQARLLTWSGTRSRPGCRGARTAALPGTYRVAVGLGGLDGVRGIFTLR